PLSAVVSCMKNASACEPLTMPAWPVTAIDASSAGVAPKFKTAVPDAPISILAEIQIADGELRHRAVRHAAARRDRAPVKKVARGRIVPDPEGHHRAPVRARLDEGDLHAIAFRSAAGRREIRGVIRHGFSGVTAAG